MQYQAARISDQPAVNLDNCAHALHENREAKRLSGTKGSLEVRTNLSLWRGEADLRRLGRKAHLVQ